MRLCVFRSTVVKEEGNRQHQARDAEEEEDGLPAEGQHDGRQGGRGDSRSPLGPAIPDGGGLTAFRAGEPVGGELGGGRALGAS